MEAVRICDPLQNGREGSELSLSSPSPSVSSSSNEQHSCSVVGGQRAAGE